MSADAYSLYQEGKKMLEDSDFTKAIELFIKSNDIEPHFKTLELLGMCYINIGNFKASITPLAASTTLNKGVKSPSLLAEAYFALKQFDEAINFAKIALERDPNNKQAKAIISQSKI